MKHLRSLYILFVVEALLIVLLLGPFCASNAVLQWDMPGHLFSAWYTAEYLFPRWTGWNPFFFGGYPQGIFYPPLFHYLLALLSKLVGLQLGFKLLLSATIAALPPALAFLYLRIGLERERALCAAALSLALLCAPLTFSAGNNAV